MLKYKQYIYFIIISIFIFVSFTYLHPMLKTTPINQSEYTINNNGMNIKHRPPLFYIKDDGTYFIHPSSTKDAKGTFKFDNSSKQLWHFSIQKGSPSGRILFLIKKNDDNISKFIVDTKHDAKVDIRVNKNDEITIIANSLGSIAGDWGNLKITKYEPYYILKMRIIALVWILFFIYLATKGYAIIALSSYIGFLLTLIAEKVNYGALKYSDITIYTAFYFLLGFISILLYQELQIFRKFKIATILNFILKIIIFTIPIAFIVFYIVFKKPINWNILNAIYQTNPSEALGFLESFIPIYYIIALVIFFVLVVYVLWYQEKRDKNTIERPLLLLIIFILIGFSSLNLFNARIPKLINNTYMDYNSHIEHIKEFQEKLKASKIKFTATKKENKELYVLVIGESLNKNNMGIYGYFRNTTPNQSQQVKNNNLMVFNNAFSNSGNTMQCLSLALTEANQYNGKKFLDSLSFVNVFNKAGFNTTWISTQGTLSETNTIVSVFARSSKNLIDLTGTVKNELNLATYYDENVINELNKSISHDKNNLIVIHIYGNHYKYKDRYPQNYAKFKIAKPYLIGTNKEYILGDYSEYDNSVLYNDYVVSKVLDIVKDYKGVAAFMYMSDHSEDIARHRGHTAREDGFNFTMTQIPLTFWLSPEYKKRYPNSTKALISHKDSLFSNDMLYETIIGLAHIKTDRYNPKYDLTSLEYELKPQHALTLHGKVKYTNPKNFYYWRKYNTSLFSNENIKKIVINNIETVGKLNEAWNLGYRSFKINLKYSNDDNKLILDAKKYETKAGLVELLSYFKTKEIKNLLLNITNLEQSNIKNIIDKLEKINNTLNIKDKVTILLNNSQFIQAFKNAKWSAKLINDKTIINNAFDIADSKLENRLQKINYFKDSNIKFIIANFKSEFDE